MHQIVEVSATSQSEVFWSVVTSASRWTGYWCEILDTGAFPECLPFLDIAVSIDMTKVSPPLDPPTWFAACSSTGFESMELVAA
jgi:hypothetical protein|mmetsp:Transcript_69453/g.111093  ORF Transcript_69453/g.111093 Transcript_69453/m.111093 type:complete len:84 (-) Transcript_69453:266-517(-)